MTTTFDIASRTNVGVASTNAFASAVSGDGTLVTFLGDDPVSGHRQVFVKNEATSALTVVSSSTAGVSGNTDAYLPTISADGSTVGFDDFASNLVANVTTAIDEVYVKTLITGGLTLVSQTAAGIAANDLSENAALSANGNIVAFDSRATNLGLGAPAGTTQIYVKNVATGALTLVSQTATGTIANASAVADGISADGNTVVFNSAATDLGSSAAFNEVYVKNVQTGALQIASQTEAGVIANASTGGGSVSADGTLVAFTSTASNLIAGASGGNSEAYVKNLATGALSLISTSSTGVIANGQTSAVVLSSDGHYALFSSTATNLVANATSGVQQVYVKNLVTGALTLLSQTAAGVAGTAASSIGSLSEAAFSADDRQITFTTLATNLGATVGNSTVLRATSTGPALTEGAVAGDNIVRAAELSATTFTGTSDAIGGTVQVSLDTAANTLGTATVQADGTWTLTANLGALAQGTHTEIATVEGMNSYLPTTGNHSFTVESLGPTTTFDTGLRFSSRTKTTLTGTVADTSGVASLEIFDGTTDLGAATVKADGTWTLAATLMRGLHDDITAKATDGLGNTSSTAAPFLIETGIQGAPYTTYEADFDRAGNILGETFSKQKGAVYLTDYTEVQSDGQINYNYTGGTFFNDKDYFFYTDTYNADFSASSETQFNNDGSHTVIGLNDGQVLTALGDDTMTGGGQRETFLFNPNPGQELITDFQARGQGHDVISLPQGTVSSIAQALHNAHQDGQDTVIRLGQQFSITLQDVAVSDLQRNDFKLHA